MSSPISLSSCEASDLLYRSFGRALVDRSSTQCVVETLHGHVSVPTSATPMSTRIRPPHPRPPMMNVYGEGPLVLSDIPSSCRNPADGGVMLGIDEAGRGSVLGPMIYGVAYWHQSQVHTIPTDFHDSKQLSDDVRTQLFQKILYHTPTMGFGIRVLHASEISRNMLRDTPYNLNQMSHDAAIDMVRKLWLAGVAIHTCFIDTVGNPILYQRRLEREFPTITFVVESKADAKYAPCSAASVVAKVTRDRMMANWQYSEPTLGLVTNVDHLFGSGYPSDPVCQAWLKKHQTCPVFGYPDVVRFSWGPIKKLLSNPSLVPVTVVFQADLEKSGEDDDATEDYRIGISGTAKKGSRQTRLGGFLGTTRKRKRFSYFEKRKMEPVTQLL